MTREEAIAEVGGYVLSDAFDDIHPNEVVMAACKLAWPDREFRLTDDRDDDELCGLDDLVDTVTGERAWDLFEREYWPELAARLCEPRLSAGTGVEAHRS